MDYVHFCGEGEGHCEHSSDCKDGLICAAKNCLTDFCKDGKLKDTDIDCPFNATHNCCTSCPSVNRASGDGN